MAKKKYNISKFDSWCKYCENPYRWKILYETDEEVYVKCLECGHEFKFKYYGKFKNKGYVFYFDNGGFCEFIFCSLIRGRNVFRIQNRIVSNEEKEIIKDVSLMRTSIAKITISYIKEKKYVKALLMTACGLGIGILIFLMALGVINILI